MRSISGVLLGAALSISSPALAEDFPFDEDHWTFPEKGFELVNYKGKEAILFENADLETKAASFKDGIIEYDVAISTERAFDFLQFRIVDDFNYEEFYFRPHQSGKPDSTQYQPVTPVSARHKRPYILAALSRYGLFLTNRLYLR